MSSNNEGPMADPYASSSPAVPSGSMPQLPPGTGWAASVHPQLQASNDTPDYLFPENNDETFRRSWGERLTYHVGSAYLVGLTAGSTYGVTEGLRGSVGERQRIRVNKVLNATGMRGPRWGNSLGCIAMMCSIFESIAYNARDTDDLLNPAGAAALTGALYKITSGPKAAVPFALGLGAAAAAGSVVTKQLNKMGVLKNFF